MGLSHLSQNKTATLFTQLYRGHATRTVMPLANLYDDIRLILRSEGDLSTEGLSAGPPKDLTVTTKKFFRELFPVAYHNVLKLDAKQFTPDYEICLKDAYDAVQPFGDVPQQVIIFAYYVFRKQLGNHGVSSNDRYSNYCTWLTFYANKNKRLSSLFKRLGVQAEHKSAKSVG